MKIQTPSLSAAIRSGLTGIHNAVRAKLASYLAAIPSRTFPQGSRMNTNPNASTAQFQRVNMMFTAEEIVKNSDFGANYCQKRRMYCTNGMTWSPDTGDAKLDEEVSEFVKERWKNMGVNMSMQEAFSFAADTELPMRGDSALVWYRDLGGMKLMVVSADQIGEIYQYFSAPEVIDNLRYFAGIFTYPTSAPQFSGQYAAFKVYERIDQWYGNPAIYPASDVMFFKDDLMPGFRGVTKFAQAIPIIGNRQMILNATMQNMLLMSKVAAISSNNSGEPNELTYDTVNNANGTVEYVERYGDGPVVKYQYNGDSFQVLKPEHPSTSFQLAMNGLDEKAALATGFPHSFLFSPRDSGGAPSRFEFEAAGKEILRLRNNVYRPKLDIIAYVTIMDGVERGLLPAKANIARGSWNFGTLPTADAFRDDKSDIQAIRAGITTRDAVTTANQGVPFAQILRKSQQEAVAISIATQEANKELESAGYEGDVTIDQIAQSFDNPHQSETPQPVSDPVLERQKQYLLFRKELEREKEEKATLEGMPDDGVWRTINGTRVFIKDGQSLSEAMDERGFDTGKKKKSAKKKESDTLKEDEQSPTTQSGPGRSSGGAEGDKAKAVRDVIGGVPGANARVGEEEDYFSRMARVRAENAAVRKLYDNEELVVSKNDANSVGKGAEHAVELSDDGTRVVKHTHSGYGLRVYPDGDTVSLGDASPSEYIRRMDNFNAAFGDDMRLEGLGDHNFGLASSQRAVKGTEPNSAEIADFMKSGGYVKVPSHGISNTSSHLVDKTWYHPESGYLVSDTKPDNFKKTPEGKVVPVDLLVEHAPRGSKLEKILQKATGVKPSKGKRKGKLAAYMGDITVGILPEETRREIARILGANGSTDSLKVIKYGMVASELERMADPENLEAANGRIKYATCANCADEVHANFEKHILVNNGRVVDGHHYLAKAIKGKVTKSLPVIDLTPARFQIATSHRAKPEEAERNEPA